MDLVVLKANSHTQCRAHAVSLNIYIMSFPFDSYSATAFDSHMSCRSHAVLLPFSDNFFFVISQTSKQSVKFSFLYSCSKLVMNSVTFYLVFILLTDVKVHRQLLHPSHNY